MVGKHDQIPKSLVKLFQLCTQKKKKKKAWAFSFFCAQQKKEAFGKIKRDRIGTWRIEYKNILWEKKALLGFTDAIF